MATTSFRKWMSKPIPRLLLLEAELELTSRDSPDSVDRRWINKNLLYTLARAIWKWNSENTSIYKHIKKSKILGNNLNKRSKLSYSENYKTLLNQRRYKLMRRQSVHIPEDIILLHVILPKLICRIIAIPMKITAVFFSFFFA